jgi:hypothetical protein
MATNWTHDSDDEISVDDGPREDGLVDRDDDSPKEITGQLELLSRLARLAPLADSLPSAIRELTERLDQYFAELNTRLDQLSDHIANRPRRMDASSDQADESEPVAGQELNADSASNAAHESIFADNSADDSMTATSETKPSSAGKHRAASTGAWSAALAAEQDADAERWEFLLLGEAICTDDSLIDERRALLDAVRDHEPAAVGLAARLMLVQSAGADEMPLLLKEIGEAYYRWRPKNADVNDAFENALVAVLDRRIAEVGLRNSIDLVRPGDRYDAARHVTSDRGVEVTAVRGWAVLRDNGKPLTKASVALR